MLLLFRMKTNSPSGFSFKSLLPFVVAIGLGLAIYVVYQKFTFSSTETVKHEAVVEQIRLMGKIQLVQLQIRDVVEYKVERNMFLPDSKVLMIVAGEIGACIDLQKLKDSDVQRGDEKTIITLPAPEICYVKVNHERSKIHDKTSWMFLDDDAELMDKAYKEAELFLNREDVQLPAIVEAQKNAPAILGPIFSKIAGQPVEIKFSTKSILD